MLQKRRVAEGTEQVAGHGKLVGGYSAPSGPGRTPYSVLAVLAAAEVGGRGTSARDSTAA